MHSFTYSGSPFTGRTGLYVIANLVARKISSRFPVLLNLWISQSAR